jgi:hypothetical protein
MIPYSFYIPEDVHAKLKEFAKERKASALIRDAITMILNGNEAYIAGYNAGIKDAAQVIYECPEAQIVAIKGRDMGAVLSDRVLGLAK